MKDILDFLTSTVKEAYLEIKDIDKEVSLKGEKDYVTNCDLLVEKYIIGKMKEKYPNIDIISEEFNSDKQKSDKYFVIDPIDGTVNFANGLDLWGIQVAYVENNQPRVSCIYYPKLDIIIQAMENNGTYINNKLTKIKKYKSLDNSIIAMSSKEPFTKYDLCKELCGKIMRIREFGASCVGFGLVARGNIDGYCVICDNPWDIEPGLLACKEAGAKIYRDNFCVIATNSEETINTILKSMDIVFGENR